MEIEFRAVNLGELKEVYNIEHKCFPENEADSLKAMEERIKLAANLFLVTVEKNENKIIAYLNGIANDEKRFRDDFFTNASLHRENGETVFLLGLAVLPKYRRKGIGKALIKEYIKRESPKRKKLVLTCLEDKVKMYEKLGFCDLGIGSSNWGKESWHEMEYIFEKKGEA